MCLQSTICFQLPTEYCKSVSIMVSSPCVQWTAKYVSILVSFVGMYTTQLEVGKLIMLLLILTMRIRVRHSILCVSV